MYCSELIYFFLFMCINSINTINCMVYFWVNLYGLNYTVFCCKYCNTFPKASHDPGLIVCRRVRFWAEELEWNWWPSGWFSYTDIWQPCLTFAVIHSQCRNTLCSNLGMIVCTVCVCVLMFGLELLYFDKDQIHMFLLHMQLQLLYKKTKRVKMPQIKIRFWVWVRFMWAGHQVTERTCVYLNYPAINRTLICVWKLCE